MNSPTTPPAPGKAPYNAPKLTVYGELATLTRVINMILGNVDNFPGQGMNKTQ